MRLHAADSDILPREGGGSMEAGHELPLRLTTAENDRPTAVANSPFECTTTALIGRVWLHPGTISYDTRQKLKAS